LERNLLNRLIAGLLVAILLTQASVFAGKARDSAEDPRKALTRTFQNGGIGGVRQLLDPEEKTFIASANLGFDPGYYSVDQVCLLLQDALHARTTLRFAFLSAAAPPQDTSRFVSVARWIYTKGRSREQTVQMAFTLVWSDRGWTLKEIRDVP
jgi:hypothetical protein